LGFHQSLHLVTSDVEVATLGSFGELASSADGVVLPPDRFEGWTQFFVADRNL
jgi:hypothetical protein